MDVKKLTYRRFVVMGEFVGVADKSHPMYSCIGKTIGRLHTNNPDVPDKIKVLFSMADDTWFRFIDENKLVSIYSLGCSAFFSIVEVDRGVTS